jgi:hypothetical protein
MKKYHIFAAVVFLVIAILYLSAVKRTEGDMCADINEDLIRDNCYIDIVIDGDYSVCGRIENQYTRDSCLTLKEFNEGIKKP